jgi:hypothetical protein
MTATAAPTVPVAATRSDARPAPLWKAAAVSGVAAAVAVSAMAGVAMAAGVPVAIEGEQIPFAGFAQLTLMCTAVGLLLAKAFARWASTPRRTFTVTAVALTVLSVVPDLTMPMDTATRVVLIATHVVAAAIVIPAVSRRLPERTR